jgi:predicted transcriptional regulator of viral defense system
MTYLEFKNTFRDFPLISSSHIFNVTRKPAALRWNLVQWQKKGLVIKLKRGLYILNVKDRKIHPSRIFIANALYSPSYVSNEYGLSYYSLIPEMVVDPTSVTTKKTNKFANATGTFHYQHLKDELFFGFIKVEDENGFPVLIAEPEKAILDFFYFNQKEFNNKEKEIFALSYRFQNLERLKKRKLKNFAKRFNNKAVLDIVNNLLSYMKERS